MPQAMREGRHAQVQQEFADFKTKVKLEVNAPRLHAVP